MRSQYKLVSEIGNGGFGVVEHVVNKVGESLARKTFRPKLHSSAKDVNSLRRRFTREVRTQVNLDLPCIMPVIDYDLTAEPPWFVMPLADEVYGTKIIMDRNEGMIDETALADILNALDALHSCGHVHRDLNPHNILRIGDRWVISDFGAVLPPSGMTVTQTGSTTIYTENYCAPEQKLRFHEATAAADIYSFGCILHDVVSKNERIPYAQCSDEGPLGFVIEKCTEAKAEKRPSMEALRTLVEEAMAKLADVVHEPDEESSMWLSRLGTVDEWTEEAYSDFARFFCAIDHSERAPGHEYFYVGLTSTPFMTRIPAIALGRIAEKRDGIALAVIKHYCDWARSTSFTFAFADSVAQRLAAIFESGDLQTQSEAVASMIQIGASHNRWHVMRMGLRRCTDAALTPYPKLDERIRVELIASEMEDSLKCCADETGVDVSQLAAPIRRLLPS